jgi:hypothetical protein
MAQAAATNAGNKPASQLKTASDLVAKIDKLRQSRQTLDNQWKLNLAFYKGRQYSYFNRTSRQIQTLPTDDGDKPRYRVRLVSNQIITGSHSLLSKFTKTKPVITATPGSGSQSDVKAAQMAERLMEFWWDEFRLDDKLEEALLWSIITGQGYWKVSWDPNANKQMRFLLDPQGNPVIDDSMKTEFMAQLKEAGIEAQEKVVNLGDIRVEAISPFDVYLDPTAKHFEDCKYVICVHSLEPDEIKARWGVDVTSDALVSEPDASVPYETGQQGEKTVRKVYIGYFLPTASNKNGRYVVFVKDPNQILEDKKWADVYPINKLPIVKFPGLRNPGQIYDGSFVEQAIPLQKELNRTLSQIVEWKNLTIRPRVWAPTGSLRTRITSEPGIVYEYNPIAGLKPEVEQPKPIPPYIFEHLTEISGRIKEIFALTEVSEGTVPPNVEAGIAIDLLQELSADRLAPTIKLIEKSLAAAGQLMLSLAQTYYIEPRFLKIRGSGGATQVQKFTQADIEGGTSISVETGSGLPRTRAGRQAQIMNFIDKGIIPPDKAWKYIDIADLKGLAAQYAADEDQAYREIEKLITGEPVNPMAVADAEQALQQGKNPDTGQPLGPQDNPQQILQKASLQPLIGENYDVHLDVLSFFMKGVEFEALDIQIKQAMIQHWELTLQAKLALPGPLEAGKVNTNVQIKATMGPTVASKLLTRQGIMVTPEEASEPPLETWVSDSVDDPDADATGPGEEGNNLAQAAQVMLKAQTDQATASLAAQQNKQQHEQSLDVTAQKAGQDAQLHQQKMAHAEELHQQSLALAAKKTKESSFKPQPKKTGAK